MLHDDPRRMPRPLPGVNGAAGGHATIEGAGRNGHFHHAPRGLKRGRSTDSSSTSASSSSDTSSDDTSSSSESSSDSDSDSTSSSSSGDLPPPRPRPRPPLPSEPPKPSQPTYVTSTMLGTHPSAVFVAVDPHQFHPDSGSRRRASAMSAVEKSVLLRVRTTLPHRLLQAVPMRYLLALLSPYPRQNRC
jgi:hypothetical protein